MADVSFTHPEYKAAQYRWAVVDDACSGQEKIKSEGEKYLPKLNDVEDSAESNKRYERYKARAVFYNITGRTKDVLTSAAFKVAPASNYPASVDYITHNIDGSGVSLDQQAHSVCASVLKSGRHGLLVDYPVTEAPASRAKIDSGLIQSTVVSIDKDQIINWSTAKVGAKIVLVMVVIAERVVETSGDGFGKTYVDQCRVLRLTDGRYTQELWRKNGEGVWFVHAEAFEIKDSGGGSWGEIPFVFVGSVNNDSQIDPSPLYDMAEINIAHYRNSADYEDGVFYAGQAQPWMAGLDEEWRDWMQDQGVYIGSRAPILLPEGGQYGIAQASPNTQAKEAMDQKESQMVALGARLIQPGSAVKTATEAQGEQESNHSVLSLVSVNVSDAYTKAINWMLRFMGGGGEAYYAMNTDFNRSELSADVMTGLSTIFNTGQLPKSDMWRAMRRTNLIEPQKTDEEIKDELEGQMVGADGAITPAD